MEGYIYVIVRNEHYLPIGKSIEARITEQNRTEQNRARISHIFLFRKKQLALKRNWKLWIYNFILKYHQTRLECKGKLNKDRVRE